MMKASSRALVSLLAVFLTAAGCSFDLLKSSSLPDKMPDDVVFTYNSNGGMLPAWRRISIRDDELLIEDKKSDRRIPTFEFATVSTDEQEKVYEVFRENKFDLIENYEPSEITYDAGSESLSIRIPGESHNVSSGDNSPMTTEHGRRYSNARKALFDLVKSKKSDLQKLRENTVILRFNSTKHREFLGPDAKRASITYENAARVAAAARNVLKENGREELAGSGQYGLQLIPFKSDDEVRVYVKGICGDPGDDFSNRLLTETRENVCTFSFVADPWEASVSRFEFTAARGSASNT